MVEPDNLNEILKATFKVCHLEPVELGSWRGPAFEGAHQTPNPNSGQCGLEQLYVGQKLDVYWVLCSHIAATICTKYRLR